MVSGCSSENYGFTQIQKKPTEIVTIKKKTKRDEREGYKTMYKTDK